MYITPMAHDEILIVEDEQRIQELIKSNLLTEGYIVHQAFNLNSARRIFRKQHIDLVCLDINLPDGSGYEFCKELQKYKGVKVIILTQKVSVNDRLTSFNIGADDYIPKPFYPSELKARINKQLQGSPRTSKRLNLKEGRSIIMIDDIEVYLTTSQYLFMEALLSKSIHTRQGISKYISTKRKSKLSDASLTVLATRLRKKIRIETREEIFKSHYSKGYRLIA